jgi:hypothetical protein
VMTSSTQYFFNMPIMYPVRKPFARPFRCFNNMRFVAIIDGVTGCQSWTWIADASMTCNVQNFFFWSPW